MKANLLDVSSLWPQADACEDVGEFAFVAEFREDRIDFQVHQPDVAFFDGCLQPLERLIFIAESRINRGDRVGRNVPFTLQLL